MDLLLILMTITFMLVGKKLFYLLAKTLINSALERSHTYADWSDDDLT